MEIAVWRSPRGTAGAGMDARGEFVTRYFQVVVFLKRS